MARSSLPAHQVGGPRGRARACGAALTALGFFALFALILLSVIEGGGTNAGLYRELQKENGLPEDAGLTIEELDAIDQSLADYLAGDEAALDDSPFNERERSHMADVFGLFALLRTVRNALLIAAVLLLAAGVFLRRGPLMAPCLIGLALLLLPLLGIAIWAASDFTAAFEVFHRTFFANDLWILYPETDLLIRLCPERFFSDFAVVLAVRAALTMAAVPLVLFGLRFGRRFV